MTEQVFILFEVEKRNRIQNVAQFKNSIPFTMHTCNLKRKYAEMLTVLVSSGREGVYFVVHGLQNLL